MTSSTTPEFDSLRHKRSEREGYNLIAERYHGAAPTRARLTQAVLDAAGLGAGQAVLDLASGPGVLGQAALQRVAPGPVLICDIAERALAVGRAANPALLAAAADAEALPFADASFDHVLCGLGLMFLPDIGKALGEMRRVLRAQGALTASVWGPAGAVPLVECALACIQRLLPPPKIARPSPLRFGTGLPEQLVANGFAGVEIGTLQLDFEFADAPAYWQAFRDLAGGAAAGFSKLPPATLDRFATEVGVELEPYRQGQSYRLSSRVIVATARKS